MLSCRINGGYSQLPTYLVWVLQLPGPYFAPVFVALERVERRWVLDGRQARFNSSYTFTLVTMRLAVRHASVTKPHLTGGGRTVMRDSSR